MTCIVGLIDKGRVWMGADSSANFEGDEIETWVNPKVFPSGEYLIGFTGSFRVGQQLQHGNHFKPLPAGHDIMAHLVTVVMPDLKKVVGKSAPDEMLIAHGGRLFKVGAEYVVSEHTNYAAVGTGKTWAQGNMHGGSGEPSSRLRRALSAAQAHCSSVREPFVVQVSTKETDQ